MAALKIESKEQALLVLDRIQSLRSSKDKTFGDASFPEQLAFINDNSPLCAALCTRRAGKSYAVGLKLFKKGFEYPGCTVLYLALTRDSAKRIMWKDVLREIAADMDIAVTTNSTDLEMTLPNGSVIKLAGADASVKEREKFLGGKYPYVAIDEAGSFSNDLSTLVYEYLEPAVADYDGSIDLIGTPTVFWASFFCKVTEDRESGWVTHKWNTSHNPHMIDNWEKRLRLLKERNALIEQDPSYIRMYLGQWVKDFDSRVYKYKDGFNQITADLLPRKETMEGQVLGMDLGFNDATSYVLGRYYQNNNDLFIINAHKKEEQIIDDVVEDIKQYIKEYDIHTIVIDNASKQVVESLKVRFDLYDVSIYAAEKTDKFEFIGMMNSDFIMGRIKLVEGEATKSLAVEYRELIKDPKSAVPKEHDACANHCADAALYMWRYARNYLEKPLEIEETEEEAIEREMEETHKEPTEDEIVEEWEYAY